MFLKKVHYKMAALIDPNFDFFFCFLHIAIIVSKATKSEVKKIFSVVMRNTLGYLMPSMSCLDGTIKSSFVNQMPKYWKIK